MTDIDLREDWPVLGEVPPEPDSTAQSRACARGEGEDPAPVPSRSSLGRARFWLTQTMVPAITAAVEKKGTLADSQPPTFRQAWARHRECAGHYSNPLARGQRLAYGGLHLALVKAPVNYIEWATDSELRAAIHVLLALAIWLGLLLGGYL